MSIHWMKNVLTEEEIRSLAEENVSIALLDRLKARIARRDSRLRHRNSDRCPEESETRPTLPEVA
ncbi:MAG: hypothetical protein GY847_25510 [Proteobacteria bacterium]|nr:hypothetical protein [Pseudomonadota bacterium]